MNKTNAKLSNIVPFKENGLWFLKLIYKYEDSKGNKHTVVIPKASIPFDQMDLPSINEGLYSDTRLSEPPCINCNYLMVLYKSVCDLASERGIKERAVCFDIITEYASREMTLDEIEKELGYKVKIINKEN